MIGAIVERSARGVRAGQDVVLVAGGRRPHPRNLVALGIEDGRALDVVAVGLRVAMQIGYVTGDQLAPDVVPGAIADASARIDPRRVTALFLAEIGAPGPRGGASAYRLGLGLANLVGLARSPEPLRGRCSGCREANHPYCLIAPSLKIDPEFLLTWGAGSFSLGYHGAIVCGSRNEG
jgi:hypothetical protein